MKHDLDKDELITLLINLDPHESLMTDLQKTGWGHSTGTLNIWNWHEYKIRGVDEAHIYNTYIRVKTYENKGTK